MMKVLSCYKQLQPDNLIAGGLGQGGGGYWQESVGVELQRHIARKLDAALVLHPRPHGRDSFDRHDYDPPASDFDIAYLQLFEVPKRRPAEFVWSMVSDYIGMEAVLEDFLERAKPDLIISLQYPLDPPPIIPSVPQLGTLPNLVHQCADHDCVVAYLPWFNTFDVPTYIAEKTHAGMCTGKMSGTYPHRDAVWRYLGQMDREDVVLSGNPHGSSFTLNDQQYREALARTKYYFSGGIYDLQIPPKYYEVCNYGACLVSHHMPMMEASGFVPYETYYPISSLKEIPDLLESDAWQEIAPAGQRMVHQRHSIERRAADIVQLYREITGQ